MRRSFSLVFMARQVFIAMSVGIAITSANGAQSLSLSDAHSLGVQEEGVPVVVGGAKQYDFVSRINGQAYRVMVAGPTSTEEQKPYPVLYVLDGNTYFAAAAQHVQFAPFARRYPYSSAIVVGVGYPVEGVKEAGQYGRPDFSGPGNRGYLKGIDKIIHVLLEEVKPFIASRWRIDEHRQSIFGHSGNGITVIRLLLQHPTAFNNYIAADASAGLRGGNFADLFPESVSAFQRIDPSEAPNLLTIWSGTDDDSVRLGQLLAELPPDKIKITTVKFPDDNHVSLGLPAISKAIHYALKMPALADSKKPQ